MLGLWPAEINERELLFEVLAPSNVHQPPDDGQPLSPLHRDTPVIQQRMEPKYHPQHDPHHDHELGQKVLADDDEQRQGEAEDYEEVEISFEELGVFGVEVEGVDVEGQNFEDGLTGDLPVCEEVDLVEEKRTDQELGKEKLHLIEQNI